MRLIYTFITIFFYATSLPASHNKSNAESKEGEQGDNYNNQNNGKEGSSSKNDIANFFGTSNHFELGVFPLAIGGVDYDKNRYLVYLGSDKYPHTNIHSKGSHSGPFKLVESTQINGNLGLILSPATMIAGTFIGLGIGISGGTKLDSSRIATNIEEAKEMKRIKKFPRTVEEIQKHKNGTIIISKLSGNISFLAKAIVGYVNAFGPEIVFSGEWMVKVEKRNSYNIIISLKSMNGKSFGISESFLTTSLRYSKKKSREYFFSFDLSLDTKEGMDAYDNLFKGRISSIQKHINKGDLQNKFYFTETSTSIMDYKLLDFSFNTGIPILYTKTKDFGSRKISYEKMIFLQDQDDTIIGSIPDGSELTSFEGVYQKSLQDRGLLSNHKSSSKQFKVNYDEIKFPDGFNRHKQLNSIPETRLFLSFAYSFQKNNWNEKEWNKNLNKLSASIGFNSKTIDKVKLPFHRTKKIEFAALEAKIKISHTAFFTILDSIKNSVNDSFKFKIIRRCEKKIERWFSNEENNSNILCKISAGCKSRVFKESMHSIEKSIKHLYALNDLIEKSNYTPERGQFIKLILKFGKHFSKNQFIFNSYLDEIIQNRKSNPRNDFAFCINWKGSAFRQNQLVLYPSLIRKDRNTCFLKEETTIEELPKKNDRELFGSSSIL